MPEGLIRQARLQRQHGEQLQTWADRLAYQSQFNANHSRAEKPLA
jgi:hypothetical protein